MEQSNQDESMDVPKTIFMTKTCNYYEVMPFTSRKPTSLIVTDGHDVCREDREKLEGIHRGHYGKYTMREKPL